ncbi:hypothetical protein DSECCO2_593060 [anaerobic digester metagenome]
MSEDIGDVTSQVIGEQLYQNLRPIVDFLHYMVDEALLQLGILDGGKTSLDNVGSLIEQGKCQAFRHVYKIHVLFLHQVFKQQEGAESDVGGRYDRLWGSILLKENIPEVFDHLEKEVAFNITLACDEILKALDLIIEVFLSSEDRELLLLVTDGSGPKQIGVSLIVGKIEKRIVHQFFLGLIEPGSPLLGIKDGRNQLILHLLETDFSAIAGHQGVQRPGNVFLYFLIKLLTGEDALENPDMALGQGLQTLESHGGG